MKPSTERVAMFFILVTASLTSWFFMALGVAKLYELLTGA